MRLDLDKIKLSAGPHTSREQGMCAMEAAAYIAGEEHGWKPQCVSPAIRGAVLDYNDGVNSDEARQRLKEIIPVIIDSVSTEQDEQARRAIIEDWRAANYNYVEFNGLVQAFIPGGTIGSFLEMIERAVYLKE